MRRVHTAPMEIFSPLSNGTHELEPYEAGWAGEALALVYVRETHGPSPTLDLRAQISADGYRWMDFGPCLDSMTQAGGYFLQLTHFGNWLRLVADVTGGPEGEPPAFIVDFYWVLKE